MQIPRVSNPLVHSTPKFSGTVAINLDREPESHEVDRIKRNFGDTSVRHEITSATVSQQATGHHILLLGIQQPKGFSDALANRIMRLTGYGITSPSIAHHEQDFVDHEGKVSDVKGLKAWLNAVSLPNSYKIPVQRLSEYA